MQGAEPGHHAANGASLSGWDFGLELRGTDLRRTEIIPTVNQVLENLMLDDSTRQRTFVVLTELLNNALDHGVLELESAHKSSDGFEHYIEERQKRLAKLDGSRSAAANCRSTGFFGCWSRTADPVLMFRLKVKWPTRKRSMVVG